MKKIKYYETMREKDKKGNLKFEQCEGYFETLYDSENDMQIRVVFRKDDALKWKCTHLESGILIISGYETKKACIEKMLTLTNKIAKIIKRGDLKNIVDELEIYRNGVELNYALN